MASTAPEDLLVKIFLQQPLKSLGQLRCVCKYWNQVISSEFFIKTHQKTSTNINKYLLLEHHTTLDTIDIHTGSYNVLEFHIYDDIFGRDSGFLNRLEIYGICDGLLCLSEEPTYWMPSNHRIFLWNPILRKGKKLPPLGLEFQTRPLCLCFGHHADDYKVIAVAPFLHMYHVCIYSLSTDTWKFLKSDIINPGTVNDTHVFDFAHYPRAKLVNGAAYFLQFLVTGRLDGRVVSFDLSSEKIRYIHLPKDFFNIDHVIEEYGKSIALLSCGNDMVMWVLRVSDDNSFIWDKKFSMEKHGKRLLGLVDNDKIVMRNSDNPVSKCFLYNVENGSGQHFPTLDRPSNKLILRINYFTESLVLLGESTTNSTQKK